MIPLAGLPDPVCAISKVCCPHCATSWGRKPSNIFKSCCHFRMSWVRLFCGFFVCLYFLTQDCPNAPVFSGAGLFLCLLPQIFSPRFSPHFFLWHKDFLLKNGSKDWLRIPWQSFSYGIQIVSAYLAQTWLHVNLFSLELQWCSVPHCSHFLQLGLWQEKNQLFVSLLRHWVDHCWCVDGNIFFSL